MAIQIIRDILRGEFGKWGNISSLAARLGFKRHIISYLVHSSKQISLKTVNWKMKTGKCKNIATFFKGFKRCFTSFLFVE